MSLQIFGLALPFWNRYPVLSRPGEFHRHRPGCATSSIARKEIALQLEHACYGFLADQRRGLYCWQGTGGMYFTAKLAATDFGRDVFRAVEAGRMVGVCPICDICQVTPDTATDHIVDVLAIYSLNLMLAPSWSHYKQTFVTADRALFQRRMQKREQRFRAFMYERLKVADAQPVEAIAMGGRH